MGLIDSFAEGYGFRSYLRDRNGYGIKEIIETAKNMVKGLRKAHGNDISDRSNGVYRKEYCQTSFKLRQGCAGNLEKQYPGALSR